MLIVLSPTADSRAVETVSAEVTRLGCNPRIMTHDRRTVIGVGGGLPPDSGMDRLGSLAGVDRVLATPKRYKLASRDFQPADSVVGVDGVLVGGGHFQVIAGPCAVESREQLRTTVANLAAAGVKIIRGGAYKPRTSPYDFQGLGHAGLELLAEARAEYGVRVVTEVISALHIEEVAEVADILQIGSRNAQNYELLSTVAGAGRPVLLKRGMATSVDEWLSAAEYLMVNGCSDIILCERGIKTFETGLRNTLDVGGIALAKRETHLPVIVDPSHAAGCRDLVAPLAMAGIAAGADGVIVESHCNPGAALCDSAQQLPTTEMPAFLRQVNNLAAAVQRMH